MNVRTSNGFECEVQWAGESLGNQERVLIQMDEIRPLVQLVAEFDGIDWIETSGPEGQPDKRIEGPMVISGASRLSSGNILITIVKTR